jgi:PIN domain nuclease of toxin-antitoxin system
VRFLLDTHISIWAAADSDDLPGAATDLILDEQNELFFSAASIWEVAIKAEKEFADFPVNAERLRLLLGRHGYMELAVTAAHTAMVGELPILHNDPFDRLLIAQALAEELCWRRLMR